MKQFDCFQNKYFTHLRLVFLVHMRRCSFRRLRGVKTSFQLKGTESIQAASGYFNLANTIDGKQVKNSLYLKG